ncbi:MAG: efflux RND transporter periplasmic adaptor subunit [Bacteroidales bacterium]|nr:efflux RND transporter periplasmic adaptor subunit [Bacteroidales bacterium]
MTKKVVIGIMALVMFGCQTKKEEAKKVTEGISVSSFKISEETKTKRLKYSGTIEAYRTIPLTFQVTGIAEEVYVNEGDRVKKGQLLAKIESTDYENVYKASLAKYEQAKDAYNRLKSVYEQGSLPEIKWVEITTGLEQARSSMEIAKNNLNKCRLFAPEDGFIGRRNIEPGQSTLAVSAAPIELVKIEKVYIKISVPEQEINSLKVGMHVQASVEAAGGETFEGTISSISPVAEMLSRTYPVKILVNNPSLVLKPGMVCDVVIDISENQSIVLIPYRSVTVDDRGKAFVFVIDTLTKKAIKRYVQLGNYKSSMIEVTDGLKKGDIVVVDGKEKLTENQLIEY